MQYLEIRSDDGTPLRLARWGEADRDVLIVHGLAEHEGRYHHVGEGLAAAGWRATFVELRGHGKSGGKRGHVMRWHEYVEDFQAAAATIGRPYVVLAHSMGGLVALSALHEPLHPPARGLVVSNPLLGVAVKAPAIKVKAAGLLSRLLPRLSLANEIDTNLLCHDPEIVRAYEADPLVFGTVTPRWFTEASTAMEAVLAHAERGTLPLRLLIGEADGICDHTLATRLGERWGGPKTVVSYPGHYHELFNEPDKAEIIADCIRWMDTLA